MRRRGSDQIKKSPRLPCDLPSWTYCGKEIKELHNLEEGCGGFVYEISFDNGMKYLGRKTLRFSRKRKGKRGRVIKESDWKKYYGSSVKVKTLVKKGEIKITERKILRLCYSKWELSYYETKYLFDNSCIIDKNYYNGYIQVRIFRKKEV